MKVVLYARVSSEKQDTDLSICMFWSKPATIPDEIGHPAGANRPPLPGRLV